MYNPQLGETIKYHAGNQGVLEAVVVRINAKTVSLSNNWRVSPVFILDPMLDAIEALNAVVSDISGKASGFKVGDKVKAKPGSNWAGRTGVVIKRNPKTIVVRMDKAPNALNSIYTDTVRFSPSFIEAV